MRIWDLKSKQHIDTFDEHDDKVRSIAFSPDGRHLASGASDNSIHLLEFQDGSFKFAKSLYGHTDGVWGIAFNPANPNLLASASWDGTVRLWEVETEGVKVLAGHRGPVLCVAISPDGKLIASGASDKTIRLWETETGDALDILDVHKDDVTDVAFSPDGRILASGSLDETIRFRDLQYLDSYEFNAATILDSLFAAAEEDSSRTSTRLLDLKYLTALSGSREMSERSLFDLLTDKAVYIMPSRRLTASDSSAFKRLYERYLYLLPFRKENLDLVEAPRKFYLQPINGFEFPAIGEYQHFQQPRSPRVGPIEWVLSDRQNP